MDGFEARMRALLGADADAFFACLDEASVRGLRLNPRRAGAESAAGAYLDGAVPWWDTGRYVRSDAQPGRDVLHVCGAYYMQEPSAMSSAAVLAVRPGETALDLCAAPGGKSGQIAESLDGRGVLVANEFDAARARVLASNLERLGVPNAVVVSESPDALAARWGETFDAILVDAPCSGEGMFRRVPGARSEWTEASPEGCARRQAKILDAAAALLKPGGRMVYSTCTFNDVEDEGSVRAFLARHADFRADDFVLPGVGASRGGCLRLWPHEIRGEGHFVARMVRLGDDAARAGWLGDDAARAGRSGEWSARPVKRGKAKAPASEGEAEAVSMLLRDVLSRLPFANVRLEGDLLRAVPDFDKPCRALMRGVPLCRVGRGFVVPEHALAMAIDPTDARRVLAVSESDARVLLSGQSVPCDGAGWTLATYRGMPLCWGKAVEGVFKNHLPKGLRQ